MLNYNHSQQSILLIQKLDDEGELLHYHVNKHFSNSARIIIAHDGDDAVRKINNQQFDFIVGVQDVITQGTTPFLHEMHTSNFNSKTPVVIIEDGTQDEYRTSKIKLHFLPRPVNFSKLMGLMASHLNLSHSEQFKSAELFSRLVDIVNRVCSEAFTSEAHMQGPQIKPIEEPIVGECNVLFHLECDGYKSNYVISIDEQSLGLLSGILASNSKADNRDIVAKAFINVAFRQLARSEPGLTLKLHSKKILGDDDVMKKHLDEQPSVYVPLDCARGTIRIYCF